MAIKYIGIYQSEALKFVPKLGFLVWKQTIWQPWIKCLLNDESRDCEKEILKQDSFFSVIIKIIFNCLFKEMLHTYIEYLFRWVTCLIVGLLCNFTFYFNFFLHFSSFKLSKECLCRSAQWPKVSPLAKLRIALFRQLSFYIRDIM
jgi:hypothetical protein